MEPTRLRQFHIPKVISESATLSILFLNLPFLLLSSNKNGLLDDDKILFKEAKERFGCLLQAFLALPP